MTPQSTALPQRCSCSFCNVHKCMDTLSTKLLVNTLDHNGELVSHTCPPAEGSGIIAYTDLCLGLDPVLANQIRPLLYDISLKLRDIALASSKDMVGHTALLRWSTLSNRARMSCTGKTIQINALHHSLDAHNHNTDDIV